MECYLMTGSSDFLLRVVVPDLQTYERFTDKLTRIPGISNIQTSFALKPVIYKTELPIYFNIWQAIPSTKQLRIHLQQRHLCDT